MRLRLALLALLAAGCAADPTADMPDPLKATDCVAFTREVYSRFDEDPAGIRRPGARPRLQPLAFWFGPRLGTRRANLVIERPELHVASDSKDDETFATYWVSYQLPADGCRSGALPGSDTRLPNWGPGQEIQLFTIPLLSGEAKVWLQDDDTGRVDTTGPVVRTADGRLATIAIDYADTVVVIVSGRVVSFGKPGDVGVRAAVRRLRAIERR